jgi:hypothetical protein
MQDHHMGGVEHIEEIFWVIGSPFPIVQKNEEKRNQQGNWILGVTHSTKKQNTSNLHYPTLTQNVE